MYKKYRNNDGLQIHLPETILMEIHKCISRFYPNECGGIFVGKIDNESFAVIEKMMLPKKFRSSPVYFLRVTEFLNRWLNRVFKQSDGQMIYLGEWHSHPNGSPIPSSKDTDAMEEISKNENIRIKTPLLLIVGYNGKKFDERFYIYQENKLTPYSYEQ